MRVRFDSVGISLAADCITATAVSEPGAVAMGPGDRLLQLAGPVATAPGSDTPNLAATRSVTERIHKPDTIPVLQVTHIAFVP